MLGFGLADVDEKALGDLYVGLEFGAVAELAEIGERSLGIGAEVGEVSGLQEQARNVEARLAGVVNLA